MPVKVRNQTTYRLSLPMVGGPALRPGEARVYETQEYDIFVNDPNVQELLKKRAIKVYNDGDTGSQFSSAWDVQPHLTLGTHQYWIDATGTTRFVDGEPASDLDGEPVGSAGGNETLYPVYMDHVRLSGKTFGSVRLGFFNYLTNKSIGTWDTLYMYCYISIKPMSTGVWSPFQQFADLNTFFTYLETNLQTSGSTYNDDLFISMYESVDTSDTFPMTLIHRNSLVASIRGGRRYTSRSRDENYGVDVKFNSPSYYLNFYNELGRRFVEADTGFLPATNNDGVVWHPRNTRTMYNLPKLGTYVYANVGRGVVWDTGTNSWVAAPASAYVVQQPFVLVEYGKNRLLSIETSTLTDTKHWGIAATKGVAAIVFPLVHNSIPQYRSYMLYPYGTDSFVTEYMDTAQYELAVKMVYRNTTRPNYDAITTPVSVDSEERIMWSHWKLGSPNASVMDRKEPSNIGRGIGSSHYPDKVYVARRNKLTGVRSKWYPLYTIRRRLPHAPMVVAADRFV